MTYNYHTHTYRCGHASGTPEEYIRCAIAHGVRHMGFSDHAPFIFPDGYRSAFRVPFEDRHAYVKELAQLREKYRDELELHIGFEMEYYPSHFKTMLKNAVEAGGEYLILGQHFVLEEYPHGVHSIHATEDVTMLREYVCCVVAAIQSGVFTYVAHPDMYNFVGDPTVYAEEMRKICVASREHNVPLEINCLGIRDHRIYPNEAFWAIVGEEQSPVTIGFDAHEAIHAFDGASLPAAKRLIETYHLHYIGKPRLVLLQSSPAVQRLLADND